MNKSSPTRTKRLKDILLVATYPLTIFLIPTLLLTTPINILWIIGFINLIISLIFTISDDFMENNILWDTGIIFYKDKIRIVILALILWCLIIILPSSDTLEFLMALFFALYIIGSISFMILTNLLLSRFWKPYQEGLSLYDRCDFTKSKAAFKSLLEKNPEDKMAWCALTLPLSRLKEYEKLEYARKKALQGKIKTWPLIKKLQMSYFYSILANSWENLREYDQAQEYADKALEFNDMYPLPLNIKGYLLLKQEKLEEGAAYINKAFKLHVSRKDTQLNKACLLSKEGNHKRSHQLLDYILTHNPEYPYVYLRKGELLLDEGKLEEAKVYLNKFKMICPVRWWSH